MSYFPATDQLWETVAPDAVGFNPSRLEAAIAYAEAHETNWPRDLNEAGATPGMTQIEPPPWNEILGPLKPRGGPSGLVLKGGRIVARWGDPSRVDMTFSIAKSYLAVLAGVAVSSSTRGDSASVITASIW